MAIPLDSSRITRDSIFPPEEKLKNLTVHGFLSVSHFAHANWQPNNTNNIAAIGNIEADYLLEKDFLAFGMTLTGEYGYQKFLDSLFIKNVDEFVLSCNLSLKFSPSLSFKITGTTNSQVSPSYDIYTDSGSIVKEKISGFLAPGYLRGSASINYRLWKGSYINLGIAKGKITFVRDQQLYDIRRRDKLFGVEKGKKYLAEYGWGGQLKIYKKIGDHFIVESSCSYFMNKEKPKLGDLDISHKISLIVNKYIKTVITTRIIYDEDIIVRTQWQQQLLVGYYF